jgi:hypothetical protein
LAHAPGSQRILDQLELQREELAAASGRDAAKAAPQSIAVNGFTRNAPHYSHDLPRPGGSFTPALQLISGDVLRSTTLLTNELNEGALPQVLRIGGAWHVRWAFVA